MKHWRMNAVDKSDFVTELWVFSEKSCKLCLRRLPRSSMVSDHDHVTGLTRAAICRRCNGFLGHMETSGKTESQVSALMRERGLRAGVGETVRRMRSYQVYWRLVADEFVIVQNAYGLAGSKGGEAGWEKAWIVGTARAMLRYKRWIRKTYGRAYTVACWMDTKPHTHKTVKDMRRRLIEGLPESI
ncbi:hypothetical protein AX768_07050 [Burkholderia sp. PAMC 28687]|nr:hypothetical protein AX768_07050 [Burkholderia sp. PAMC 28687]